eukprot:Tbor_TRINITY_DN3355_c0_g1::TRINITY_DN3355_c0_g1_i1::g.23526::m.23526
MGSGRRTFPHRSLECLTDYDTLKQEALARGAGPKLNHMQNQQSYGNVYNCQPTLRAHGYSNVCSVGKELTFPSWRSRVNDGERGEVLFQGAQASPDSINYPSPAGKYVSPKAHKAPDRINDFPSRIIDEGITTAASYYD